MMIIHLQHSLVYNDTAHISCITTNYSVYNENVHPFWGAAFAVSKSNFSLSSPLLQLEPPTMPGSGVWPGGSSLSLAGILPVRAVSAPHLGLQLLWLHKACLGTQAGQERL